MKPINELRDTVRETSCPIHPYHGHGHLEKVYENEIQKFVAGETV